MILEILGYSALIASVTGSTLVFLDKYSLYAYVLWGYSNPIFIYFLIIGYSLFRELYFVAFLIMTYTAMYGFFHTRRKLNRSF